MRLACRALFVGASAFSRERGVLAVVSEKASGRRYASDQLRLRMGVVKYQLLVVERFGAALVDA